MHQILHILSGPVIGGLIGYFTNYLAIKMLFWPRTPKKIGNFVLPFTPGVIPRRKDMLAREIGEAVADKMFTRADIEEVFLSEQMKQAVTQGVLSVCLPKEKDATLAKILEQHLGCENSEEALLQLDDAIRTRMHDALQHTDLNPRITYECRKLIYDRIQGTVLSRAMTPDRIESLSDYLGRYLQQYVRSNCDELILPVIREEISRMLHAPFSDTMAEAQMSEEKLREWIAAEYTRFMDEHCMSVAGVFDIASLTERKIIEFKPEEIESLVQRTIKNEMQMVINLGAVLGALIGLITSFL